MPIVTEPTTIIRVGENRTFKLTIGESDIDTSQMSIEVYAYLPGATANTIGTKASGAAAQSNIEVECDVVGLDPGFYVLEALADPDAANPIPMIISDALFGYPDTYLGVEGSTPVILHIIPSGVQGDDE